MNLNSLITGPARLGLTLGGRLFGALQSRLGGSKVDDETLQREVEGEVLASRRAPKGKVEVSVEDGVVWLRGEVKAKTAVDELENRAASVEGVERVENLLRVAKPARKPAAKAAKPAAKAQKRPAAKRSPRPKPAAATAPPPEGEPVPPPPAAQQKRTVTQRVNAEKTSGSEAEPTPADLAATGQGRQPAPLGAEGAGSAESTGSSAADAAPGGPQTAPATTPPPVPEVVPASETPGAAPGSAADAAPGNSQAAPGAATPSETREPGEESGSGRFQPAAKPGGSETAREPAAVGSPPAPFPATANGSPPNGDGSSPEEGSA